MAVTADVSGVDGEVVAGAREHGHQRDRRDDSDGEEDEHDPLVPPPTHAETPAPNPYDLLMMISSAVADQETAQRRWWALVVLILPVLIISMDATVLSFAVPKLSKALEPSSAQLLWMIDIYSFVLAGLL